MVITDGKMEKLLQRLYSNPELYSSPDMFSPPTERKPYVLRLELTQGCDYGGCTFCTGYRGIKFKQKSFDEFQEHFRQVEEYLGEDAMHYFRRFFIGGGNALAVETSELENCLKLIRKSYRRIHADDWVIPKRIAIYGRTDSILAKTIYELEDLWLAGLNLIFWGIESGSNKVLDYVNKGTNFEQMDRAGRLASKANLQLSVMIMPGLGGIKFYESHVQDTARLLGLLNPKYVTFMGVNAAPSSRYVRMMTQEKDNRPLTDIELVEQVRDIVTLMPEGSSKVGMYDFSVDQVGHNPVVFNQYFNTWGKEQILKTCQETLNKLRKKGLISLLKRLKKWLI